MPNALTENRYKATAALSSLSEQDYINALFPGLAPHGSEVANQRAAMSMTNSQRFANAVNMANQARSGKLDMAVAGASAPLWSILAAEYIDATEPVIFPFDRLTTKVEPEVTPRMRGAQPTIAVKVVTSGGTTVANPSTFGANVGIASSVENVSCSQYHTPGELSTYEIRNFETVRSYVGAMIRSHGEALVSAFASTVAAAAPTASTATGATTAPASGKVGRVVLQSGTTTGPDAISPAVVAKQLSPLFRGNPDLLLLNPEGYAGLIATDKLGFGPAEGQYGVRHIHNCAPWPEMDNGTAFKSFGAVMRRNAVAMAMGTPFVDEYQSVVSFEPLGSIYGVPMWLATWFDPATRTYKFSVDSLVGFKLVNPAGCYLLSEAVAAAPTV